MSNHEMPADNADEEMSPYDALLGPFHSIESLPADVATQDGLIALGTTDDSWVCPTFQFDTNEQGERVLNQEVAEAWKLYLDLFHKQMSEDLWNISLRLVAPRQELGGLNVVQTLKDFGDREAALNAIVNEAREIAGWSGIPLILPPEFQ